MKGRTVFLHKNYERKKKDERKRVAWWLATCARKPKVPARVRLPAMRRGELSAVIARLMSKCR